MQPDSLPQGRRRLASVLGDDASYATSLGVVQPFDPQAARRRAVATEHAAVARGLREARPVSLGDSDGDSDDGNGNGGGGGGGVSSGAESDDDALHMGARHTRAPPPPSATLTVARPAGAFAGVDADATRFVSVAHDIVRSGLGNALCEIVSDNDAVDMLLDNKTVWVATRSADELVADPAVLFPADVQRAHAAHDIWGVAQKVNGALGYSAMMMMNAGAYGTWDPSVPRCHVFSVVDPETARVPLAKERAHAVARRAREMVETAARAGLPRVRTLHELLAGRATASTGSAVAGAAAGAQETVAVDADASRLAFPYFAIKLTLSPRLTQGIDEALKMLAAQSCVSLARAFAHADGLGARFRCFSRTSALRSELESLAAFEIILADARSGHMYHTAEQSTCARRDRGAALRRAVLMWCGNFGCRCIERRTAAALQMGGVPLPRRW